jgi:hypothetical protein
MEQASFIEQTLYVVEVLTNSRRSRAARCQKAIHLLRVCSILPGECLA